MLENRSFAVASAAKVWPVPAADAHGGSMTSGPSSTLTARALHALAAGSRNYLGPERRQAGADLAHCLRNMLDEIDYGMLLVGDQAQLLYINHAAKAEMDARHPLQCHGQTVQTLLPADADALSEALRGAQRGRRKLLLLGEANTRISLSVVPLAGGGTLLVLGKRQMCEQLSVQGFARSVGLTAAETRVLEGLCNGVRPRDIAIRQGVAVSTIRTQIGSIRAKTGVASIRELVRQVAVLPPLVGALKSGQGGMG
jgi:DNA-binding CsgD family transcriptional regulator